MATTPATSSGSAQRGARRGERRRPYRPGGNVGAATALLPGVGCGCRSVGAIRNNPGSAAAGAAHRCSPSTGRLARAVSAEVPPGPQRGEHRVSEQLRLMAVHAHPDDESSKGAATMAKYVREGVDVLVVTCTGGERGSVLNPKMDRLDDCENTTE